MKRGEIWTVAVGSGGASRLRPAIVLQDDAFDATASITICPLTVHRVDAPLIRLTIEPSPQNGLPVTGHVMIDKVTTVARSKLQEQIGRLSDGEMLSVNRAVFVFFGLAAATARQAQR